MARESGGRKIRVLVADDHRAVRQGLTGFLAVQRDIEITGEAGNGIEAIAAVEMNKPDVVLMDINMPLMDGMEATRQIKRRWPKVKVVGLSMHDEPAKTVGMSGAGADAYVAKWHSPDALLAVIRECVGRRPKTAKRAGRRVG